MHTDVWGSSLAQSSSRYPFYITFIDAFSKYTWIYLLKHKSDCLATFKLYQSYVTTRFSAKIKLVQSDFRGEFRPFTRFVNDQGIPYRLTCPDKSHKNGTVERKHVHIVNMGLTFLAHASISINYWDHSFTTARYLINGLLTIALPCYISTYLTLHNKKPDYASVKVLKCSMHIFESVTNSIRSQMS